MSRPWAFFGLFVAVFGIVLLAAGWWAWSSYRTVFEPFPSGPSQSVPFEAPPGSSAGSILAQLEQRGVLADARLARLYLVYWLGDPPLRAGEYQFDLPSNVPEVLSQLIAGRVVLHPVTIREGLTLEEIADHLSATGFGEREELLRWMSNPALIADLDPEATDLEGYLFPDTYAFESGASEQAIVAKMVRTFRQRLETDLAPALGHPADLRRVVTLASIVEKEATLDAERPMIAGVYANRLRIGMGLYADPTIIYALMKAGRWDGNLRRVDLELDSPYNTYRYPGLPPGPICSPGLGSLLAAAQPATVPYLYFVSRNDGSHVFAETLGEHNRNVEEWQRRYWRERRQRQESGTP